MKNQENKKLGDENPYISLKVKGMCEKEALFRIKRGTQLKKLMNAYCNMKHFDFYSIMFLFNGYQLRAEQTPLELDMKDGNEIEAVIDGIDDDEQDDCCSTHLVDEDGTFNAVGLDNFIKKVKLEECGISYAVVAIMGPQSSGMSQTTKGIWIARCAGIEPCTIVMDLEGTSGREIGEDDTAFEKRSALFALAVSDIVLINMWCHDIGLEQAANTPLLRTVFQAMLRLFVPRKTSLLFVIRDKTRTPLEILEPVLREDIQKIWDSIPKPEAHKHTPLSVFFNVQVVALSSYEDKEEQFKEQVFGFRQKFFQSITPGGLAADRRGVVPASGFSFSVQQIWKVIKENKDLDLVAHKVMVATVRCDEIAKKKYSSFVSNKEWIELQKILQSLFIPSLGVKLSSLLYNCLSSYDEETSYFEDSVRSAERKQLEENLMQVMFLVHFYSLNNNQFVPLFYLGHSKLTQYCFIAVNFYGIKQVFWDLAKVRDKLSCDLDSLIAEIRTAKLSELSSLYESEMKEALYGPVEALLKGGRADTVGLETMNEENKKLGGDENPRISLRVKGIGEKEALFTMKRSTQLKKLMNAYCSMKYVDHNSIIFLFSGYQLRAEQTPLELDMEDGDEIEALIDAIDDDEQDDCCSTQLVDKDGAFNAVGLDNFIKKVKLAECGISYVVVAIIGPQGSGMSQTTKGVWIARCVGIEPCTIVMDLEGTNGREIGEDDTEFETQSAVFALAVSDIVLINMWCRDIWLQKAANTPLLKTIFQVMLRLSIPRKTSLLFVIRDKTRTPLEILEPVLREDIQKIWDSIPKPDAHKHTPLSVFVNVQVVALSSYEDKEEQFKEQVVGFRQKFFQSTTPGGLAGDRRGLVPASGFSFSAQQIWKVIKENKDLDLVAHNVMVATVLCDEVAKKKYSSFVSNKEWIELQKVLQSLFIPSLGEKLSSLLYNCLSSYDEETSYFEDSVRSAKRKQLEENLMQLVQPAYQLMLGHILPEMLGNFKKALNDALGGGLGFAVAARDCSKEFTRLLDEKYGIKQVFWDLAEVRDRLSCDLDSQIAEIRTAKLSQLSSQYESQMKEALCGPVEALLKGGRDDTWSAIRNLLHQETAKAVSEFSFALSGFEISEEEKEDIISNLKNYSRGLVEGKAREEAGKVLYHMKERFTYIIKHDDDSMPRVWTGKEDIQAIIKNAHSSSLSLLSMLAAIRLDEETDTIRDTLVPTLMDPRIGSSKSCYLRDPLASSTWEEVPATKTLITPAECKSLWNQFIKETKDTVAQPIASQMQMPHAVGSSLARPPSTPGGYSIPSSSLRERNTSSRGPCTSGSGHLHDFGERGGKGGVMADLDIDGCQYLQFAPGTRARERLQRFRGWTIRGSDVVDVPFLTEIEAVGRYNTIVPQDTPFRRLFDTAGLPTYPLLVLEFLCTFAYRPVDGDFPQAAHDIMVAEPIAVHFSLFGVEYRYTLRAFAVLSGLYTEDETLSSIYTQAIKAVPEHDLEQWWKSIADIPVGGLSTELQRLGTPFLDTCINSSVPLFHHVALAESTSRGQIYFTFTV
ncbi:hypothetical protein SSX86_013735 [Deinandra increscens subsp. villosa]|uniref:Protein SEY1 homolog n=1 Tax=Deinandra increscens subsp. villosa TaxID=3103831 RepID=A0AAP0D844_9ASTR